MSIKAATNKQVATRSPGFSDIVDVGNNRAVELMRDGRSNEAIGTLVGALGTWNAYSEARKKGEDCGNLKVKYQLPEEALKEDGTASTAAIADGGSGGESKVSNDGETNTAKLLQSVKIYDEGEAAQNSSFPFLWYSRAILLSSERVLSERMKIVAVIYNLGVAHQLEALHLETSGDHGNAKVANLKGFDMYGKALKTLERIHRTCQTQTEAFDSVSFEFLHTAIVNNLLYCYSEMHHLEGMSYCLDSLKEIMTSISEEVVSYYREDFQLFQWNAVLDIVSQGGYHLAPAA
jgi:hypothetical protein